jgi:DNA-binding XRE family transcriptional regulator
MSAVKPACLATSQAKSAAHHADGTLSRCHHLLTDAGSAPMSTASASRVGHNSMTARNDLMSRSMRRNVSNHNPHHSTDPGLAYGGQNVLSFPTMATETEDEFTQNFLARIRAAREFKGFSQAQMATLLGIGLGTYNKYETRTVMPHFLLKRFCAHTGANIRVLYGMRGDGGTVAAVPIQPKPVQQKKRARR